MKDEHQESELKWASRLDTYCYMLDSENHLLSVLISWFAVILPSVMVADIMPCDVSEYEELEAQEEDEKSGWKLARGDVFRPPQTQICCVFMLAPVFSVLGRF